MITDRAAEAVASAKANRAKHGQKTFEDYDGFVHVLSRGSCDLQIPTANGNAHTMLNAGEPPLTKKEACFSPRHFLVAR